MDGEGYPGCGGTMCVVWCVHRLCRYDVCVCVWYGVCTGCGGTVCVLSSVALLLGVPVVEVRCVCVVWCVHRLCRYDVCVWYGVCNGCGGTMCVVLCSSVVGCTGCGGAVCVCCPL